MRSQKKYWTTDNSLQDWERLKRLSFVIESQLPLGPPSLSAPNDQNVRHFIAAESTPEVNELVKLLYSMGIVDPEYLQQDLKINISAETIEHLSQEEVPRYLTTIIRRDRFVEGTLQAELNSRRIPRLCRRVYAIALFEDGWPRFFPTVSPNKIAVGLTVRSLGNHFEGRTTSGRRQCPAKTCPGWLIGVLWESGQQMHICSEGWHYDSDSREIRVIGGGEISARFVSPKPLGRQILPNDQWIDRAELLKTPAWSS